MFALKAHRREGVLHVHDLADLGYEALRLVHVRRPAGGEALRLGNALHNLAPLAEHRLARLVQPHEYGARDLVLPDRRAVGGDALLEVTQERLWDAGAAQEGQDVGLRAAENGERVDEEGEELGRVVVGLVECDRGLHADTVPPRRDGRPAARDCSDCFGTVLKTKAPRVGGTTAGALTTLSAASETGAPKTAARDDAARGAPPNHRGRRGVDRSARSARVRRLGSTGRRHRPAVGGSSDRARRASALRAGSGSEPEIAPELPLEVERLCNRTEATTGYSAWMRSGSRSRSPSAAMAIVSMRVLTMCGEPESFPGTIRRFGRGACRFGPSVPSSVENGSITSRRSASSGRTPTGFSTTPGSTRT